MAVPLATLSWWSQRHPVGWSRQMVLRLLSARLLFIGAGLIGPSLHAVARRFLA